MCKISLIKKKNRTPTIFNLYILVKISKPEEDPPTAGLWHSACYDGGGKITVSILF